MHDRDDPGQVTAGAGVSPADPGGPLRDPAADAVNEPAEHDPADQDDLVSAVEDLVRELLPEEDRCAPG